MKCNSRFFCSYGFVIEQNVEANGTLPNEIEVPVALHPSYIDPSFHEKQQVWKLRCGTKEGDKDDAELDDNGSRRMRLSIQHESSANIRELFALLRLVNATHDELCEMTSLGAR
jgi:hypothetical protein